MMAPDVPSGTPTTDPLTEAALRRALRALSLRIPPDRPLVLLAGSQVLPLGAAVPAREDSLRRLVGRALLTGRRVRSGAVSVYPFPAPWPAALCWLGALSRRGDPSWFAESLLAAVEDELLPALGRADPLLAVEATSPSLNALLRPLRRIASTALPLLVRGPTGTGKEVLCRALHAASRRTGEFVAENCAALPEALLESELFGHSRGAFTGADASRRGRLIQADRGTLFLDEIGDMPSSIQAKLLRALQEREVRPLGGQAPQPFDARVLAATHQDIEALMLSGRFRRDLFYRIAGSSIALPPLEERLADMPFLAAALLRECRDESGGPGERLSADAARLLATRSYPGNVRELRNLLTQASALATSPVITAQTIRAIAGNEGRAPNLEAEAILRALALSGGVKAEAARKLGWSRQRLYRRIDALQLPR